MKNLKTYLLALIAMTFIGTSSLLAQTEAKSSDTSSEKPMCCNGRMWQDVPDLTQDQMKKIEDLQIAHLKEVNQAKNQVAEKRAHLRTLQTADKVDNAAINKTIDEITTLQNDMMKKNEAHRQAVRNLLTDKQKVVFDAKHCGKMHGNGSCCGEGKGNMKGCGQHNGQGMGNGNGCGKHGQGKSCEHQGMGNGCGQHGNCR